MPEADRSRSTQLVYVTSAAHSGSTLLDMLIGTIDRTLSTGELTHLPWFLATEGELAEDDGTFCSCMRSFAECPVWSRVVETLSDQVGFDVAADPFAFDTRLIHPGRRQGRQDFLRKFQPRGAYNYVIQHGSLSAVEGAVMRVYRKAIRNNWLLIDTIGRTIDVGFVIDSSKTLRRMKMLHGHRRQDMRVIVLMRDIRGVAQSARKRDREPLKVAAGWVRHYNRTWRVLRRMPNVPILPIQYERLCDDPVGARRRIAAFLDLGDPGDQVVLNTREHHIIGGNPIRYRGRLEIRHDGTWRTRLPDATRDDIEQIARRLHPAFSEMGLTALVDD